MTRSESEPIRVWQLITTMSQGGAQHTAIESSIEMPVGVVVTLLAGADDRGEGHLGDVALARGVDLRWVPHLHRSINPYHDVLALLWLVKELRRGRPDVLHTHSSKASVVGRLAAWIAQVPAVHTIHGWSFNACTSQTTESAVVWLERLLARVTVTLVAVTRTDVVRGLALRIGRPEQYEVIRSGIDFALMESQARSRSAIRAELGIPDEVFVVGTVARMSNPKAIDVLIDGFAESDLARSGAHLVLVGDGPDRSALEARARHHQIAPSVIFTGAREDGPQVLGAFDVFALTSDWEGLPRVVIEAMVARVPVVATRVGGIAEVLESGETGLFIDVRERSALAQHLRDLARDPQLRFELAERARARIGGFDVTPMREDLEACWRSAASGRHRRSASSTGGRRGGSSAS